MSISGDVLSHILGYATKYPQKYSISKQQYELAKKITIEEFHKKYPNFMRDLETFKYHINRAALLKQWEDINIMISLTFNNGENIDHNNYVKYAITVFHRFNRDDMADELIKKYEPEFISYNLTKNIHYINTPNELVLLTRSLHLGGKYESDIREELINIRKKIRIIDIEISDYQIGNVDQESWKLLTGKTIDNFHDRIYLMADKPIDLEIPVNNKLDIYSYTLKSIKNPAILSTYMTSHRVMISETPIITPIIVVNIHLMLKYNKNILPNITVSLVNPVLVNLFYNNLTINPNIGSNVIKDIIESKK